VSAKEKSFAKYTVQYARKNSSGRDTRELEDLYKEINVVNVIKSSMLRWAGHVARMDENELLKKKHYAQTLEVNEDLDDRNLDGLTGWTKLQRSWAIEIS
jgi:hypothetical protein